MAKKELSVKDMARISGLNENYVQDCVDYGVISKHEYTEREVPYGGKTKEDEEKKHAEIVKAKREGKPWTIDYRTQTAEEVFKQFLVAPRGMTRLLDGRVRQGVKNMKNDMPSYYVGDVKEKMVKDGESLE